MLQRLLLVVATLWMGLAALPCAQAAPASAESLLTITHAQVGDLSSGDGVHATVTLPDDWSETRPRFDGSAWYTVHFDRPAGLDAKLPLALYVERACSHLAVVLNGEPLAGSDWTPDPQARQCAYPQLIPLPGKLLLAQGNVLQLRVDGHALQRVSSRQRAGGLSALTIGPLATLAELHADQRFRNVSMLQIGALVSAVTGAFALVLFLQNRQLVAFGYLGGLALLWGAMNARLWWAQPPWSNEVSEFLGCAGFAALAVLAVQVLLSHANLRSRWIERALLIQLVLAPATLALAGPNRLFAMSSVWYPIFSLEVLAVVTLHLAATWRDKRTSFLMIGALLVAGIVAFFREQGVQLGLLAPLSWPWGQLAGPVLFLAAGADLLKAIARPPAPPRTDAPTQEDMDLRIATITAEMERNFAQLADLRVEQVTEKERKRIAGDLHDDLGAKLLTIVHTSDSERVSTLAREALEEMRLSVKGLTGRPMRLADALADWRAETVQRLGQANIEADWRNPAEETEQLLPARGFVQTTRILRECVSNIIKHSGASHCKVRCSISDRQFGLTVQDNGKGIPMELDGKLDRGHGMTSMKHRAKQMQGQCLVESGPGYGTVIRLTLPL